MWLGRPLVALGTFRKMGDTISETQKLANRKRQPGKPEPFRPRRNSYEPGLCPGFAEPETGIEPTPRSASGVQPGQRTLTPRPREEQKNNPESVTTFETEQDSNVAAKLTLVEFRLGRNSTEPGAVPLETASDREDLPRTAAPAW